MYFGLKQRLGGNDGPRVPEYTDYVLRTECFPGYTDAEIAALDCYTVIAALTCRNAWIQFRNQR